MMKKNTFLWAMVCMLGGNIFISCSDNDDKNENPIIEPTVYTANFTGITETTLDSGRGGMMTFPGTPGQKVIISRDSLDRSILIYKDWTGMGINYGDFSIPISVTTMENNQIVINGNCIQTLYKDSVGYEATLGVTGKIFNQVLIDGKERKDSCALLITVNMPVNPTMTLDFQLNYTGVAE